MPQIILVDRDDQHQGEVEKLEAHLGEGLLHRAYTILIVNSQNKLLIAKRSKEKPLWPLFWEASCSSHPEAKNSPGERGALESGQNRLSYELGFTTKLTNLGKFYYKAKYNEKLSEHEICYVLTGLYNSPVKPNPKETTDFRWFSLEQLKNDLAQNPKAYVPWLYPSLEIFGKIQ